MDDISFDQLFKDLFDNTNDLIHFLNLDGTIALVNPAWLRDLEYDDAEVAGHLIYEFIHPDYITAYKLSRDLAIKARKDIEIETILMSKSGKQIIATGQIGCSGQVQKLEFTRSVLKNITEKRITEKKISESEERLRMLFEKGPDAIIIIDQNQLILNWNPKAAQIFGFKAEEVLGKPISEVIIPPQYREAHKRGMAHFMATGDGPVLNNTIQITALHKTGKEFHINLSISNVRVNDGWIFIAFISDISAIKETEVALLEKEKELVRTKLLEEKRDEFISIASHELKTPLTTIKAYTQLAISHMYENKPELVKEFLHKTDEHISKLNRLISELLDVTKIHAGRLQLNKAKIEMKPFVEQFIQNIQSTITSHKIILEKNEAFELSADKMRLEQVLINLITNAVKYSPGKNNIVVTSQHTTDTAIISVKDYGIGIPAASLDKIFTRFYRVEEVGTNFNGLGIGLFISSQIIYQHGGTISVESELSHGSLFSIKLPLDKKH